MGASMKGKRVLITGAAQGIGLCTAEEFAREGAELTITDINAARLDEAAGKLRAMGARVTTHTLDISKKEEVDAMAAKVLSEWGAPDILINNAGIGHHGELPKTTIETWRRLMDVNFWGALYHVYAFLPAMMDRRAGQIVNISSGQAFFRLPTWGAYATVKLALGGFSELLHYEVAQYGIRVTTVYPFFVSTGFYRDGFGETLTARLSQKLMPYYSDTPEKVGKIVFKAVKSEKKVEMVNLLSDLGFVIRMMPPAATVFDKVTTWLMTPGAGNGKAGR